MHKDKKKIIQMGFKQKKSKSLTLSVNATLDSNYAICVQ